MAQQLEEQQTIKEFINNLLDDLSAGRITPEAALVAAGQYEGLRRALTQNAGKLTLSPGDDGGLSVDAVTQALHGAAAEIAGAPPQFHAEKPDAALSPKEVLSRASSLRASEKIVAGAMARQQKNVAALRKTFIERLVANWIARSREEISAGSLSEVVVRQKLEGISAQELSGPDASRVIETILNAGPSAPRVIRDAIGEEGNIKQELSRGTRALSAVHEIPKAIYSRMGNPNIERFAAIVTDIITRSDLPTGSAIDHADVLARVAEAAVDPRADRGNIGGGSGKFFTTVAEGPAQKFIAGAADALFSQLSPLARQDVIRATFSRALEQALTKTDDLTTRLGKEFVDSELFRLVMEGTKKEFTRAPRGGSGITQAKGALDDIIGAILVGPVTAPLLTNPREAILAYFELLAIHARTPGGQPALALGRAENVALLLLSLAGGPGAGAAGGANVAAAAASFSKQIPSWQTFYTMVISLVSPEAAATQLVGQSGAIPHIGVSGGGLGGAIGGALSWAGLGLAGVAGRAGGGLVGLLFGGVPFSPFGRRTQKTSFWDDTPLMIAVFIGVAIVLLFVLPTFINFGFIKSNNITAVLMSAGQNLSGRGVGIEGKNEIIYNGPPPSPASAVSGCPVGRTLFASITQCPNDNRPDYSHYFTHAWSNAFDIGLPMSTDIYSTHYGYLVEYVSDIPQNGGADYGNYVVLAGTDPSSGKLYFTIYGHLLDVSTTIKSLCGGAPRCSGSTSARPVPARTILGASDNTGASSGPHLHYELRNADGTKPPFVLPSGCGGYKETLACGSL
ncbi:MAG: M23 family metallopeptidase [Candidatus Gottesmanbacteria bacterium]|nr:M23 family metallopeptidase [Candidatus Gottesmanbacteria bacterium]